MKGFKRQNQLLSLCVLNCGLCPMFLDKNCPGCGGGEGNQACKIARCSIEHGGVEYCFQCSEYPCERYDHIDDFDSFITHRRRKADLEKARQSGVEAYNDDQIEKVRILDMLLSGYNDGRKKTLFCLAVNLLEPEEVRGILEQARADITFEELSLKEKAAYMAERFQKAAERTGILLKLRKKSSKTG